MLINVCSSLVTFIRKYQHQIYSYKFSGNISVNVSALKCLVEFLFSFSSKPHKTHFSWMLTEFIFNTRGFIKENSFCILYNLEFQLKPYWNVFIRSASCAPAVMVKKNRKYGAELIKKIKFFL